MNQMKIIDVTMTRADLDNIPQYPLAEGFYFDFFKEGDEAAWVNVETVTDEFENKEKAWARFNREFGPRLDEFSKRCLFLKNKEDKIVGTTTAWYGCLEEGEDPIGRIHWVSILPEYQGQGLGKALLSEAMNLLAKYHQKAYLDSSTKNYRAINMYLSYGFEPLIRHTEDLEAWKIIEKALDKKIISKE